MTAYRPNVPQPVDPLSHIYQLERELENSERRTATVINELSQRLDALELKLARVSQNFEDTNRELERQVVTLAHRINSL